MTTKTKTKQISLKTRTKASWVFMANEYQRVHLTDTTTGCVTKPLNLLEISIYTDDKLQGMISYNTEFFSDNQIEDFEKILGKDTIFSYYVLPSNEHDEKQDGYPLIVDINFSIRHKR